MKTAIILTSLVLGSISFAQVTQTLTKLPNPSPSVPPQLSKNCSPSDLKSTDCTGKTTEDLAKCMDNYRMKHPQLKISAACEEDLHKYRESARKTAR